MSIPTLATYGGLTLSPGFAGQIAESGPNSIESRINENATAVDFGVAVTAGVAVGAGATANCKPVATNGDVPLGVSVRNASGITASTDGNNTVNYVQKAAVPILTKDGSMFAIPFENVTAEDAVIALPAQTGKLGGVTGGAANGTSRMAMPAGWVWKTTTLAGAVGKLRAP